jgi:hypothetical protein
VITEEEEEKEEDTNNCKPLKRKKVKKVSKISFEFKYFSGSNSVQKYSSFVVI